MLELPERCASLHMAAVYVWQNALVMVFDDQGQQMPDYQGNVEQGTLRRCENVFKGRIVSGVWGGGLWYRDTGEPVF